MPGWATATRKLSLSVEIGFVLSVVATSLGVGCDARRNKTEERDAGAATSASVVRGAVESQPSAPRLLYLPDGDDVAIGSEFTAQNPNPTTSSLPLKSKGRCPEDMVDIAGAFCIDRYEAHLIDQTSGQALSPYYPPDPALARRLQEHWQREQRHARTAQGRALAVPRLPDVHAHGALLPQAMSAPQVSPSGYLDGETAADVCRNAGKRLCKPSEWVTACRGEKNRQFPYGNHYVDGLCNVHREAHPAALLHGNPSVGHLDPRLNLTSSDRGALLRKTGETATCKSEWGSDAIYDMVGNLDEWVEDEAGSFHGGFYARASTAGCEARIATHPRVYKDYSLGVRCCK
jgi:hypothetical protein